MSQLGGSIHYCLKLRQVMWCCARRCACLNLKRMQDLCHLSNCARVPSTNVGVVTCLFGERSFPRVVCGIFFFLIQALCSKLYGAGLKSIVDALFQCVVDACALQTVISYSLVASKCLVVFLVKFTGCFYCSFFVMTIVERHHKKNTVV